MVQDQMYQEIAIGQQLVDLFRIFQNGQQPAGPFRPLIGHQLGSQLGQQLGDLL